jgi:hypothetical protein
LSSLRARRAANAAAEAATWAAGDRSAWPAVRRVQADMLRVFVRPPVISEVIERVRSIDAHGE